MPRPVEGTSPYTAGLDGLRAIAVLGVVAYHLEVGWASGGLLGVAVFFVLGLPDHRPPDGTAAPEGDGLPRTVLGAPGASPSAGALPDARGDRRLGHPLQPRPAPQPPLGHPPGRLLLQQLVVHLPPRLVLRPVRPALAAQPPLVARDRRAVLPSVAPRTLGRAPVGP